MTHRKFSNIFPRTRPQFVLAFRNTTAALLALLVAASLLLESPNWAALLVQALDEIVSPLQSALVGSGVLVDPRASEPLPRFIRHRDWRQDGQAAIRAALALVAVGTTWAVSGWTQGPLMIMAMSIMLSIFSTKDHPAAFLGQIFIGAAIGSTTAVLCRLVLLSEIQDPFLTGVILAPFVLLGAFAMTQGRSAIAATGATLFFIFVTQPGVPVAIVPHDLVLAAIAMIMGVASAWLAYRYLAPVNPAIRMHSHLAALAIGRALQETHKRQNLLPAAARLIEDTLGSFSTSARQTRGVLPALENASIALHRLLVPGLEIGCSTEHVAAAYLGSENPLGWCGRSGPCPS